MIESSDFPVHFNEIFKLISNFPPEAPSSLFETCCHFLKNVIDYAFYDRNSSDDQIINVNSIYKWLARVPGAVTKWLESQMEWFKFGIYEIIESLKVFLTVKSILTIYWFSVPKFLR
ncbi:hypothetical protein RF11_00462 [Thelohanellus kitauei]|uniref:Uncharacterized protein n=1 Tax=Thelohanellus kitauei TaxID=669202 RepID=A0A0C2MZT1_THEKT|nr:hypothetical protein RF11_00462 [Thelohanellus kitauei]